jgi:hypothetical protein
VGLNKARSVTFSGIICWVDVDDVLRPDSVKLDNCFLSEHCRVLHSLGHIEESARFQRLGVLFFHSRAHAKLERARNDRRILVLPLA